MVGPAGPLATISREPGQARKGAAAAVTLCAGVWLVGFTSMTTLCCIFLFCFVDRVGPRRALLGLSAQASAKAVIAPPANGILQTFAQSRTSPVPIRSRDFVCQSELGYFLRRSG